MALTPTRSSLICLGGMARSLFAIGAAALLWTGFLWATGRLGSL